MLQKTKRQALLVTEQWLAAQNACNSGKEWFLNQKARSLRVVIHRLVAQSKFDWANWTIVRFMSHEETVQYACLSALESLKNFESVYPDDKRPREAVQAALRWALNPTEENRSAAESAARSAWSAAESAGSAAWSAAWSAWSAARSAESAGSAAWSAESAARSAESAGSAAWSAAWSAWSAESAAWKKILCYGLKIVFKESIKHLFKTL